MRAHEADVVVIGAGVAGALVAWHLAAQGRSVILLDAGERVDREQAVGRWAAAAAKTLSSPYRSEAGDAFAAFPDGPKDYRYVDPASAPFKSTYVRRVGGSTWHWQGSTPRFVPSDFRMRSTFGVGVDWPLDYDTLEPWYARAEAALGVAGDHEAWDGFHGAWRSSPFPMTSIWQSHLDKTIDAKVASLEFEGVQVKVRSTPQARNSRPYQGRPPCAGNSTCIPICPIQAKYDAMVHVELAREHGAVLLERTVACRIVGAVGKVEGIEAATWWADGRIDRFMVRARKYVVAAHAIESARLLLYSGIGHPALVGRHLMDHPTGEMVGLTPEPVYGFRGPPVTSGIDEWRDGPWRSAHAAWKMSLGNDGHGRFRTPEATVQRWMDEGLFGAALRKRIGDTVPRMLRISWAAEQLPDPENYVELDPQARDKLGLPLVRLHYGVDGYTFGAFAKARALIGSIFATAGVTQAESAADPKAYGGSGHVIGTCRMGQDPSTSVTAGDGHVHGFEDLYLAGPAVFPTGGTANPTLTAAALALRLAAAVDGELPRAP